MSATASLAGSDAASQASWRASWKDALDAVALDVEDVEYLLDQLHTSADAAATATVALAERTKLFHQLDGSLGPVPMEFADRARSLLSRQRQAALDLARAMTNNRRHARVAATMRLRPVDSAPLYIDAEA